MAPAAPDVRVFRQARGKINKGIRVTLENQPAIFFAYNGITATAEAEEIDDEGGRLLLRRLRNFQIVNGGQTTASIHAAKRAKIDVSGRFVQMKLSVVNHERASRLVPKISEYANSQNRVNSVQPGPRPGPARGVHCAGTERANSGFPTVRFRRTSRPAASIAQLEIPGSERDSSCEVDAPCAHWPLHARRVASPAWSPTPPTSTSCRAPTWSRT